MRNAVLVKVMESFSNLEKDLPRTRFVKVTLLFDERQQIATPHALYNDLEVAVALEKEILQNWNCWMPATVNDKRRRVVELLYGLLDRV